MNRRVKHKIIYEFIWLLGIILISAGIEYTIIELFDLHPILSVKIQGFIGLVIISYGIRMVARMGRKGMIELVEDDQKTSQTKNEDSRTN